jgi:CBS-domain-containing membrane protein
MSTVHVRDVMTSDVIKVVRTTTFKELAERLVEAGVNGVPVIDDRGHLVGMVTEADLMSKEAFGMQPRRPLNLLLAYLRGHDPRWVRKAETTTAAELMTAAPATVGADDPIALAARLMLDVGVKQLPVLDDDAQVVGIVTRRDLLKVFLVSDVELTRRVKAALASPRLAPDDHTVTLTVEHGIVHLTGAVRFPADIPVVEAVVRGIPGVVGLQSDITFEERDPIVRGIHAPWG